MRNPVNACSSGGTTGGPDSAAPVTEVAQDAIDVDVLLSAAAEITVTIGGGGTQTKSAPCAGAFHFQIPFNGQTGQVEYKVVRGGQVVMQVWGIAIEGACNQVNFNAVTGSQTQSVLKL